MVLRKKFVRPALAILLGGMIASFSLFGGCASTGCGGGTAPHEHGQEGKEHPNRPR